MAKKTKEQARKHKHFRIRNKISGTKQIPRISIYKSNTNFYAQLIDDENGTTLITSSTQQLKIKKNNKESAKKIGEDFAKKVLAAGYTKIVFDRSGYIYHGKLKEFADAARKEGLKF